MGCRAGQLDQTYLFNDLTKIEVVTAFSIDDILRNKDNTGYEKVSAREAVTTISIAGGQGVKKCLCKTGSCNGGHFGCNQEGRKCNSKATEVFQIRIALANNFIYLFFN